MLASVLVGEIDDLRDRAVAKWPTVPVIDRERLAHEIARRIGSEAPIATLSEDLCLAIAAGDGDGEAARACEAIAAREVEFAATRLRATPAQADETRSDLRRLWFTGEGDRPPALSTFTGRGDLRAYARVIAAHSLARRIQRDRREQPLEPDLLDVLESTLDPEVALLRETYRETVERAFVASLAELDARQRAVLRFHLLDGWTIDDLGARYGVHRATAARWLADARTRLGRQIRTRLVAELAIGESQIDSIVALVTSRIEVSLERLLA